MKEFKGTRGEWKYLKTRKGHYYISGIGWENFCKVFTITDGFSNCKKETKANAKLIAAAPDLLKVLQELIFLHQCEMEGLQSGRPTANQWLETIKKGELAISKALD